ncbi:adaptor-related protein complex 1 [Heterostelium album PN500]|uniref:AP complex subunit beta n=1 Tax=Heterostelium pallidum (strain ATCC 26659 / Pp 5 / PN500) TaxID=670386 RepID=D3BJF3_HETP5|nr:adaptor-related protein complex 1 [Heterostelium album PN500]EFA78033.1 adaptor-related protein complex 1 [Heterostelium album PN500]|eukprot:XP_020430161.1 adaptor-related protein complex 1 [Heterostelium album PN500]
MVMIKNNNIVTSEIHELKEELLSQREDKKKEAVKKVIAAMTVGKDVSMLFTHVLNCMQTNNLELKKLVYLYVMNYAKNHPDRAILAVNTFQKDASDPTNPLIRALAIRTMGCIRVDNITEYLCEPLRFCLKDQDPYVRKTAAVCVAKLYDINPELVENQGFLDILNDMLGDSNPMVVANAVASLTEIDEVSKHEVFRIHGGNINKLLAALNECTEWGQVFILNALCKYNPRDSRESESRPEILQYEMKVFFCKYNDPIYVKMEKLEIMIMLANEKNIEEVLLEFKEYATEVDVEFVRKAVRAIGRCAIKIDRSSERCIQVLLDLIQTKVNYVVQEAIIVIKDIFRKYPNKYEGIIATLCANLESLDEPEAKASMIWIIESDNPDLRDRGFVYWRLLSTDFEAAKSVVLSEKPLITDTTSQLEEGLLNELISNISTLSSVYHKPPETFVAKLKGLSKRGFRKDDDDEEEPDYIDDDNENQNNGNRHHQQQNQQQQSLQQQQQTRSGNLIDLDLSDLGGALPQTSSPYNSMGGGQPFSPQQQQPQFSGNPNDLSFLNSGGAGGAPQVHVNKQILLGQDKGQGIQISGAFARYNGRLSLELTLLNVSGSQIFGISPIESILQCGAIENGQSLDVSIPLHAKDQPSQPLAEAIKMAMMNLFEIVRKRTQNQDVSFLSCKTENSVYILAELTFTVGQRVARLTSKSTVTEFTPLFEHTIDMLINDVNY